MEPVAVLSLVLMGGGLLMMLIYSLIFLVEGFREHIAWGFGMLFFPGVSLVFLIIHWDVAGRPFLMQLLGLVLLICGVGAGASLAPA